MYVCMHVCMYVCMCMYVLDAFMHVSVCMMNIWICKYESSNLGRHVCVYAYIPQHKHTNTHVQHTCLQIHYVHLCMYMDACNAHYTSCN
jgi:hypothetical protein